MAADPQSKQPAAKRVNAILIAMNQQLVHKLHACDEDYLVWAKIVDAPADARKEVPSDWSRKVNVTMAGPRYVSVVATDQVFCGGAHPDTDHIAMVFVMTTGDLLDWKTRIPGSPATHSEKNSDGSPVESIVHPALREMSIAAAVPECKDAFDVQQSYLVWPDARLGQLVVLPFGLPHVVEACTQRIPLTLDRARTLGFDTGLLNAIEEAHARSDVKHKH